MASNALNDRSSITAAIFLKRRSRILTIHTIATKFQTTIYTMAFELGLAPRRTWVPPDSNL
jgi:hypothetical protein